MRPTTLSPTLVLLLLAAACGGGAAEPATGDSPSTASAASDAPTTGATDADGATGGGVDAPGDDGANDDGAADDSTVGDDGDDDDGGGDAAGGGDPDGRGRTTADIQKVIKDNREPIRACYEKAKKKLPSLKGTMTIKFTLDPDGNVREAELNKERSDIYAPAIVNCAIAELKKLKFPAHAKGMDTTVNYPFDFKP